jgi:voltage-gated potassium channel
MNKYKKKVFNIIEIGNKGDVTSRIATVVIVLAILLNLFVILADTFEEMQGYHELFGVIEMVTVIIFTVEYILRVWTSEYLYEGRGYSKLKSAVFFIFSFYGIIDLLSFMPYYLPLLFPAGVVVFRLLRVFRIFRLFKINAQYDAFNVITSVLNDKKTQLISSTCLVLILMVASSLGMYSLEHEAQPDVFKNAFSGMWWSVSALLTVGYGDIYPVTTAGKVLGIISAFLGVGMVAIPTGIISAGFVEQYTKLRHSDNYIHDDNVKSEIISVGEGHDWAGQRISEIELPKGSLVVSILRDDDTIIPRGETMIHAGDRVVLIR